MLPLDAIGARGATDLDGRQLLVGEILRRAAESVPDAPAAAMEDAELSYAELDRHADRMALVMRESLGVRKGDRIVLWADTALDVVPLFVAVAKLGAVFAPLNARLGPEEAGEVGGLARGALLVVDAERQQDAQAVAAAAGIGRFALLSGEPIEGAGIVSLDYRSLPDAEESVTEPALVETDPHVIFFTSGSTGRPKGVVLSHRANWLRGFQGVFLSEPERTVCMFPLFHMAAFTLAIAAWQTRGEICFAKPTARALLDAVERRRANRLYGLPLIFSRILEEDTEKWDLSSLKKIDTGTSATPIELVRRIKERFPEPALGIYYGSTEVGLAACLVDSDVLRKPGSVGPASISADLRLGEDGEICVRSPFLMEGYFDDPEATAAAFQDGWFATGDLGAMDEEGYLSVVGRKKEVLRTGGESVSPTEVEGVLRDAPGVAEIAIVGLPDPDWGEVLCAAVVPQERATVTLETLQHYCEGRVAGFKKPRRIAILESLPRTAATSQVQRVLLVEQILDQGLARES